MNNIKILRYLAAIVGIWGLNLSAVTATLAAETAGAGNDAYLIVQNIPGNQTSGVPKPLPPSQALPPEFCPYGYGYDSTLGCANKDWTVTQHAPVTAQEAVDLAYGPNKAVVVGIVPLGSDQSAILVKAVQGKTK